jgi:hypothetical protein
VSDDQAAQLVRHVGMIRAYRAAVALDTALLGGGVLPLVFGPGVRQLVGW